MLCILYQVEFGVLWVMVLHEWVVAGSVVRDEEGPPPTVAVVLLTPMQDIRVEEESIARLHFHLHQRKSLGNCNLIL